jgi:hypothetical protein
LASLPKMNIPQIPDIEEIKRKMAEANMNFPEPVSYPDQLQAIRDLPPMNQMPTREEIQMAMQNIPVPEKAFTPAQTIQEKIQAVMQNMPAPAPAPAPAFTPAQTIQEKIQAVMQNMPTPIPEPMVFPSIPKFSSPVPQMPTREEIQMAIQNIPAPAPVFTPAQTIQEKIQAVIQNMPVPIQRPGPVPDPELSRLIPITRPGPVPKPAPRPAQTIQEKIQAAMQNMPTPTAPASSMPKFNLPQMQSFGLPQQIAGGRTLMSDFSPRNVMRMANGGGIDQAIYDLKFKLNG